MGTFFFTSRKLLILIEKLAALRLDAAGILSVFRLSPRGQVCYIAMSPSFLKTDFRKTVECPSSQTLLRHLHQMLAEKDGNKIESHLSQCDFCCAELQLLSLYRNVEENYRLAEIPVQLRRLAEDLLFRRPELLAEMKPGDHLFH